MMRTVIALAMFILPVSAVAFIASETDISQPYEIVPIEVTMPEQISFLGTLSDFPVMYEIRSEEPFTFTAQLAQPVNQVAQPFSLLLIRRNDRGGGVTEIARQVYVAEAWITRRDSLLGLSLHESPVLTQDVGPGTYRLEVSSPDNQGQYILTVGTQQTAVGYVEQLGYIRQTQAYFGYGLFALLKSSQVYYPVGILLLLGAFFQTWRFARKQRSHA
jgi:hypothetical protein